MNFLRIVANFFDDSSFKLFSQENSEFEAGYSEFKLLRFGFVILGPSVCMTAHQLVFAN